jgi:hypothetical protein
MAGKFQLILEDNTFSVDIPALNSSVGCSARSKHGDIGQMVRILISHGLSDPIDLIISTWGLSYQQVNQIRFIHMALQQDTSLLRRLSSAKHWINQKIRLTKNIRKLSASSPWCNCHGYCFCSLRGIMLTPPLKVYHNVRGIIITNDVNRAVASVVIQNSGAVIFSDKTAFELLETAPLVLVDGNTSYTHGAYTVIRLP